MNQSYARLHSHIQVSEIPIKISWALDASTVFKLESLKEAVLDCASSDIAAERDEGYRVIFPMGQDMQLPFERYS